jgi:hypothetical protein
VIEENQRQDGQYGNCDEFLVLRGTKELGKIYLEARAQDDFTDDLVQVGYCSESNVCFINSFMKIHSEITRVFSLDIVQNLSLVLWQEILESDACKFMHDFLLQVLLSSYLHSQRSFS